MPNQKQQQTPGRQGNQQNVDRDLDKPQSRPDPQRGGQQTRTDMPADNDRTRRPDMDDDSDDS
jgi:hypothetical protein